MSIKVKSNGEPSKDIIISKTFLKTRVLPTMEAQGFIEKVKADDIP